MPVRLSPRACHWLMVDAQPVRDYFASNAAYWIEEFQLDGLRLDATQAIHDRSSRHIIADIACRASREAVSSAARPVAPRSGSRSS